MLSFFRRPLFSDYRFIVAIYGLVTLLASTRIVFLFGSNNYSIFYHSLAHLVEGKSLYALYPAEYYDHYHYAPTFAALFAPVFALPYPVGMFLWQFLFAGIWVYALYRMPFTRPHKVFAYWFCLHELFTSLVNSQTNPLIAAVSLFAFICFEKRQLFWAAFFIMLGFNVKIYSLVAAGLFLLYPQRGRFLVYLAFWGLVLALLPLLFTTPDKLLWQYEMWGRQLFVKSDGDKWVNTSIHRLIHLFVSPNLSTAAIIGAGVVMFCTVYVNIRSFREQSFRLLVLASVLLFQVLFNPVSESPTYITAVTGVLCWWVCCPQATIDRVLLVSCFVLTVLSPSDIFPAWLRDHVVTPYALKALPCALIWFRVIYLLHQPAPVAHQQPASAVTHG